MKLFPLLIISLIVINSCFGQNKLLTLKDCLDFAIKNNLDLKSQDINTTRNKISLDQSMANVLPTINAGAGINYNFGRTIDRFTNQFIDGKAIRGDNYFVQGQLALFNGLQNYNSIKQNQQSLLASKLDYDAFKNNLLLSVSNAFLQLLLSKELLAVAQQQVLQTDKRVIQIKKQVDAGAINKLDLLNTQAQKGNEELNIVNAENNYLQARLNLFQLMNMEDDEFIDFASIANVDQLILQNNTTSFKDVYAAAEKARPEIKSQETKLRSAMFAKRAAIGGIFPTVSLSGSIGTGYSGQQREVIGSPTLSGRQLTGFAEIQDSINNRTFTIPTYQPTFDFNTQTISFGNQIKNNINRSIGLSIQIPIFNGLRNYGNIKQSKLNEMLAQNNLTLAKQQLFKSVQQAYLSLNAAQKKLNVAQESFNTQKEAFKQAESRFDNGLLNATDFAQQKNNITNSESNLLQSKYDYLFKLKVIELYTNNNINF